VFEFVTKEEAEALNSILENILSKRSRDGTREVIFAENT